MDVRVAHEAWDFREMYLVSSRRVFRDLVCRGNFLAVMEVRFRVCWRGKVLLEVERLVVGSRFQQQFVLHAEGDASTSFHMLHVRTHVGLVFTRPK